jgi:hypothetical protein
MKMPITKTELKKRIVKFSSEHDCKGLIREYSWRGKKEWNGDVLVSIEDVIRDYDPDQNELHIHYWHRPAPGCEPEDLYTIKNFGKI